MNKVIVNTLIAFSVTACNGNNSKPNQAPKIDEKILKQTRLNKFADSLDINIKVLANKSGKCKINGAYVGEEEKSTAPCIEAQWFFSPAENYSSTNWALYFSQTDTVKYPPQAPFDIEHINGDLHKLTPNKNFTGFKAGESIEMNLIAKGYVTTEAEFMPNMYIAVEGLEPAIIKSTELSVDPETGLETRSFAQDLNDYKATFKRGDADETKLATSKHLFEKYLSSKVDKSDVREGIIPTPLSLIKTSDKLVNLNAGIKLKLRNVNRQSLDAALLRLEKLGVSQSNQGLPVYITQHNASDKSLHEAYELSVKANEIVINAWGEQGAFYGLISLASLIDLDDSYIPQVTVKDKPRYPFRGMHVDVARNFHSKMFILDLLDQMAAYKLNKLHLHLGEDEGWRLEINGLPELTDVGSKRCHDVTENTCLQPQLGGGPTGNSENDGYYSIKDYIEIIRAANARHIQVIPSFDMPGHSRALIKSMEARYNKYMKLGDEEKAKEYLLHDFSDKTEYSSIQNYNDNTINVCMESTYRFLNKLMTEMKIVHQLAGQPLTRYHIGADETAGAWKESPICKAFIASNNYGVKKVEDLGHYFIERISKGLAEKNIEVAGWSDGMGHTRPEMMPDVVQSNAWGVLPWGGHAETHKQINNGWEVILSTPDALYFDLPYESDPKEPGYTWASRHISSRKVFQFMPENLPIHAEIWEGPSGKRFTIDDRLTKDDKGVITNKPIEIGKGITGIQGQLWSETIRSDDAAEYQIFPRMLSLAERAWHQAEWEVPYNYEGALYNQKSNVFNEQYQAKQESDWLRFSNVLSEKELPKLELAKIAFRLPPPGAVIEKGKLVANSIFPTLEIEFRLNKGKWQKYLGPTSTLNAKLIEVRTVAPIGKRKGRTILVQ